MIISLEEKKMFMYIIYFMYNNIIIEISTFNFELIYYTNSKLNLDISIFTIFQR